MHAQSPLEANNSAFYGLQQANCEEKRNRQPSGKLQPYFGLPNALDNDHNGNQYVTYDHHGEIGWGIVGTLVVQVCGATWAGICDFEESPEQKSLATRWATTD